VATGDNALVALRGAFRRGPGGRWIALCLSVLLLGLAGFPPTIGFVAKRLLFAAALGPRNDAIAAVGLVNSIVSVYYYARIMAYLFRRAAPDAPSIGLERLPLTLVMAAVVALAAGFFGRPILAFARGWSAFASG
jgi:NADH:ubiquinone oxidoreductase subunit 2 (subunit N)